MIILGIKEKVTEIEKLRSQHALAWSQFCIMNTGISTDWYEQPLSSFSILKRIHKKTDKPF